MGDQGGIIALYFNGATCTFKELPSPKETEKLDQIYKWLDNQRNPQSKKTFFILTKLKQLAKK